MFRANRPPADLRAMIATITLRRIRDGQRVRARERERTASNDVDRAPDSQPDLDEIIDQKRAAEAPSPR